MKRKYLRLVRRAYRYLRHPRIRERPWLYALTKPLYNKDLWRPCKHTVAGGISTGIFFAMLPIPFQMLISAIVCMRTKVNVPIGMATCWISNPLTHPPLIVLQIAFGNWIRERIEIHLPFDKDATFHFMGHTITGNPADFFVGCITMATLLSLISYPIIFGIASLLPHRHKKSAANTAAPKALKSDPTNQ